jgi:hypothetical protein
MSEIMNLRRLIATVRDLKNKPLASPRQYYRLQTVDGDTVYRDYESFSLDCPDERGTHAPDAYALIVEKTRRSERITEAEAALGIKCKWVEVYFDSFGSDDMWLEVEDSSDPGPSDPNTPLVTVEQTEESKRKDYVEETTFGPIRQPPKPYHLTINRPQDDKGWLAAHDQLFLDGPTYTSQYRVVEQMRASLIAPPLSDGQPEEPEKPDEHTCFDEFRRLMAQWVLKLPKDELDKLRKTIRRTSNPKYWEKVAKELSA